MADELAPGQIKAQQLQAAYGLNDEDVGQWADAKRKDFAESGFSDDEINDYFGIKAKPDLSAMQKFVSGLTETAPAPLKDSSTFVNSTLDGDIPPAAQKNPDEPKEAQDFIEAAQAGYQSSLLGLVTHGKRSVVLDPELASPAMEVAYQLAQLAPDFIPGNIAGSLTAILGGAAGTAIAPGVGTAAGIAMGYGAGMFGITETARRLLIDHYEKGEHRDWNDFWTSLSAAAIAGGKSAAVGAATFGVGGAAGKLFEGLGVKAAEGAVGKYAVPLLRTAGTTATEIATMVTAGAAVEGEIPKARDFTNAGAAIAALHALGAPFKLREIYKKTGLKPEQVADHTQQEPVIMQDVLSKNVDVPRAYEGAIDTNIKQQMELERELIPKDSEPLKQVPGLGDEFAPDDMHVKVDPELKAPEEPESQPAAEGEREKTDLEKAHDHFEETTGEKQKEPLSLGERLVLAKDFAVDAWKSTYTGVFDKYDPVKEKMKEFAKTKDVKILYDAYKLIRTANDAPAKARHAFEKATFDFNTFENNGKPLGEIINGAVGEAKTRSQKKQTIKEFEHYLAAKRALEYEKRGLKSGFDPNMARIIIEAHGARFEEHAQELVKYQNRMLDYLKDSGRISQETYDAFLEANPFYLPFKRLRDGDGGKKGSKAGSLKKVKGIGDSTTDINIMRPLEAIAQNTQFFFELAEQNRAKRAFVNAAIDSANKGGVEVIKKVPAEMLPIRVSPEEMTKMFEKNGVKVEAEDAHTIFRPRHQDLAENQFEVYRGGKREVYETTPELAEALKAVDAVREKGFWERYAMGPAMFAARTLRLGTSLSPDFIARNFFRDQLTAKAFSKAGMGPMDSVRAVGTLFSKPEAFYEMLKSGGAGGAYFELNDKYLESNVYKLAKETGFMDRAINVVTTVPHALKVLGEFAEQSTRTAEFIKTTQGDYSPQKLFEAGFNAREVTVDFQRMGAKTAALNGIIPFFNAQIQGADRAFRAVKENPGQVSLRAIQTVTYPSVMLWFANHDYDHEKGFVMNPRYAELRQWERDLNWIVITDDWQKPGPDDTALYLDKLPAYMKRVDEYGRITAINKGEVYRFPKSQELGLLYGTLSERLLELTLTNNPRAMKDFGETVQQMLVPTLMPTLPGAAMEMAFNKNLFTGAPIIPSAAEKLAPELRYTDYTSDTAKKLGQWLTHVPYLGKTNFASPAMIDHFVQAFTGNSGKNALSIIDGSLRASGIITNNDKPELAWSDIPFVRAFVIRNPSFSAQSITDFREKFAELQEKDASRKFLDKREMANASAQIRAEQEQDIRIEELKRFQNAIANAGKQAHRVNADPRISRHEKRQMIDGWYYDAISAAREGLQRIDEYNTNLRWR